MMELSNDVRTPTGETIQVSDVQRTFYNSSLNSVSLMHGYVIENKVVFLKATFPEEKNVMLDVLFIILYWNTGVQLNATKTMAGVPLGMHWEIESENDVTYATPYPLF